MRKIIGIVGFFLAALLATSAFSQPAEPAERRRFSQMELDQMLAPIALYPDALLSQVLMAATYPQDVYEAASWSQVNRVSGEQAVRAVENQRWDPSVISLAAFPQVLAMMDERREWTERLGDAFLAQPEHVMDTVQELRRRAYEEGNLRTTEEIVVQRQGTDFVIDPPSPEAVYVPYYDPRVVYGTWWWPGYDPVWWSPWGGYSYSPSWVGFGWGPSIFVGSRFFFGGFDWRHRYVRYSSYRPWYWRGQDYRQGYRWTHNRDHRWRDRNNDGRPDRLRDRDRNNDGRPDRWRDRDRDGRPDAARDGRWRDRDGDGRRDGRGGRGGAPSGGTAAPQSQHGFFAPQRSDPAPRAQVTDRNPMGRPVAPTYRTDARPEQRQQALDRWQARERVHREQAGSPMSRQPVYNAPRTVHVPAPQPQPRAAPQHQPQPQPRAAPQPSSHPMTRAQPVERSAPAPAASAASEAVRSHRSRER